MQDIGLHELIERVTELIKDHTIKDQIIHHFWKLWKSADFKAY
jgi:hypothetical protein